MRRFVVFFISIFLLFGLTIPVLGANEASNLAVSATVNRDKSCQVTVLADIRVDSDPEKMRFPIPADAEDVVLNGMHVTPELTESAQYINLGETFQDMTGIFTLTIGYRLPGVIGRSDADTPELQLPILSGFEYPVKNMKFTVNLPETVQAKPAFSSGYHKSNIEKFLTYQVDGTTITGTATEDMKDHETLTMYLPVEERWFPDAPLEFFESGVDDIAMVICTVVALLYWIFFMRSIPPRRTSAATAPEGVTAGQIGAVMTLGKADLTLMVFSWAKLGYIQIETGKNRVKLHKRMEMGNERAGFEQKAFRMLFGKHRVVNTAGAHYSACRKAVSKMATGMQSLVHPRSGNPRLFRALFALVSLFGGVSFGIAITQEAVVQSVWIFLTASIGLVCGWFMQLPLQEICLRKSRKTLWGIVFTVVWLAMGIICGQPVIAVIVMVLQWLAGLMAFFCGRRTEAGWQDFAQLMGLRHYLKTVSKEDIAKLRQQDPEYFHSVAPWALALGVCYPFSLRFGKTRIPDCPYITTPPLKNHSAREWSEVMVRTVYMMNRSHLPRSLSRR